VTIDTRKPRLINADGEIGTETPATFSLLPKALTVMVPQDLMHAPGLSPR
jgi:diacylglycerol kinase family enzyme